MKKRISVIISVIVLACFLSMTASAAVLQIDAANITADNYQNNPNEDNPAGHHVFPPQDAVAVTPNMHSPDATIVSRWTGTVRAADDNNVEGERVIIDGASTVSITIPFVDMVHIESMSMAMNHSVRGYFFKLFVSADGENWTEVTNISAGAERGNLETSYDNFGDFGGPRVNNVWRSDPGGGFSDDIGLLTLRLAAPTDAVQFLRFTFYGHDGERGDWEVTDASQWIGMNNLSVTGSVAVPEPVAEEAPAEVAAEAAPATPAPAVTAPTPAPRTNDGMIIFAIVGIIALAGAVLIKRRISVR